MSSGDAPTDALISCVEEEVVYMEEEKARMEAEIHQKKTFVSRLRARKSNPLLPIFRLPPETLAIIFIHGACDYYYKNRPARRTSCIPSWVNVSYVCSHWRNIALNFPSLWIYHFNLSLRWTEELLLRSKQASLKISCFSPFCEPQTTDLWWSNLVDNLLEHSGRIQELHLCLLPELLPITHSLCAHRLEDLDIQFHWRPDWSLAITGGDTPVLRTLRLSCCPLPWYSLNLSKLNSLSLHHAPVQLHMADFLALLSGMQDLTLLNLERVLPSARGFLASGGLGDSPKIDLPHLALLAVVAPLSTVVALLSSVNIPLKTHLSLTPLFERGSSVGDYAPISSFLAQQFSISKRPSSSCPIFRSLVIDAGCAASLTFSSLERDCYPHIPLNDTPPNEMSGHSIPLKITLGEDNEELEGVTESDKHRIMSDICCSLPFTNVQTLHVTQPEFPPAIWKEILRHLDGLHHMRLSDGCMPDLSILSHVANEPKENPGGKLTHDQDRHIFVPALEELVLCGISFIRDDATPHGAHMSQSSLFGTLSTRELQLTMIGCEMDVESDG